MSQQMSDKGKIGRNIGWMLKAVGAASLLSVVLLLIMSVILWKMQPEEKMIMWGIRLIYIFAAFIGGFFAGKMKKKKKFICGLIVGMLYYVVLIILSILVNHSVAAGGADILQVLLFCLLGGMLGGMLA